MRRNLFIEIIALLFVSLFLYTAISKIIDFPIFKEQVAMSPMLAPISKWVAILLPGTEIIVSIFLFIPGTRLKGLNVSLVMMLLFTGYVIYILLYNEHLPCTCGGILEALSWKQHMIVNFVLILLALAAILTGKRKSKQLIKESKTEY